MTRDSLVDVDITSNDEFRSILTEAVEQADNAGVDVRGAWEFKTRGAKHHWEVEIVELLREDDE